MWQRHVDVMSVIDQDDYDRGLLDYEQQYARQRHIEEHGFVRITAELTRFLAQYGPWVEIGAGTGKLSAGIRLAGGRSLATDNFTGSFFRQGDWMPAEVFYADAERVARLVARSPTLNLLCSWPYESDWCFRAVRHLRVDQLFGYIGEGPGGQTGDVQLHELLEQDFVAIDDMPVVKMLATIHDHVTIYRRAKVTTPAPHTGVTSVRVLSRPEAKKPARVTKRHGR